MDILLVVHNEPKLKDEELRLPTIALLSISTLMNAVFAGAALAGEPSFYASVGVSLSQTNGLAETDSTPPLSSVGEFPEFPDELPLNGSAFDDDDTGWAAALGYRFTDYFAMEVGFEELGTFQAKAQLTGTPEAVALPLTIDASGFSLAAQFGYPLSERLRATWHLGVVRAGFDAEGEAVIAILGPGPSFEGFVVVPYVDPDDETGYRFGFGVSWAFNQHFEAELAYSHQDLQVLDFDSFALRLIGRL